jgi:hypothetical protein
MLRSVVVFALSAILLSACGSDPKDEPDDLAAKGDDVALVGKDIKAGVYTAKADSCLGFTATTREFTLDDEDPEGEFLSGGSRVRDLDRIVLNDREFFHTVGCPTSTWKLDSDAKSVDPGTVEGACKLLIEDEVLAGTLTYPKDRETAADESRRSVLQDQLFSIVTAGMEASPDESPQADLADSAGQLVDFLDDPKEYVEDGHLVPLVSDAVAKIKKTCD